MSKYMIRHDPERCISCKACEVHCQVRGRTAPGVRPGLLITLWAPRRSRGGLQVPFRPSGPAFHREKPWCAGRMPHRRAGETGQRRPGPPGPRPVRGTPGPRRSVPLEGPAVRCRPPARSSSATAVSIASSKDSSRRVWPAAPHDPLLLAPTSGSGKRGTAVPNRVS